jgi:tRNA(Ser,Leu) C12 N-acetylase TAN1
MEQWNVVISTYDGGYRPAKRVLARFGKLKRTPFFNVLFLQVDDTGWFLDHFDALASNDPQILTSISRVAPAAHTFTFHDLAEFESKARDVVLQWVPQLAGKSFHIRIHRRGFKGRLSSHEEEKILTHALLDALAATDKQAKISFEDPDAIIAIDTVGSWVGVSLWTREDLKRFSMLKES